jgi:hypothetical protein
MLMLMEYIRYLFDTQWKRSKRNFEDWQFYKQQYRQCMFKYNVGVHLCNHCCSGKAINITYYECAFLAFSMQHAMHVHHIVICGLNDYTIFPHYLINSRTFGGGVMKHKMCVLIFSTTFIRNFSRFKKN